MIDLLVIAFDIGAQDESVPGQAPSEPADRAFEPAVAFDVGTAWRDRQFRTEHHRHGLQHQGVAGASQMQGVVRLAKCLIRGEAILVGT